MEIRKTDQAGRYALRVADGGERSRVSADSTAIGTVFYKPLSMLVGCSQKGQGRGLVIRWSEGAVT